jgi:hypothetical protein
MKFNWRSYNCPLLQSFVQWPLINRIFIISNIILMDHELGRKKRRIVVTHFDLSWNDWKPEETLVLRFGRDSKRYTPALKYALRCLVCETTSVKITSHLRLMIPFTNKLGMQSHRWNLVSEIWTSPLNLVSCASCSHPSRASCKFVSACR